MELGEEEWERDSMLRVWTREIVHMSKAHAVRPDLFCAPRRGNFQMRKRETRSGWCWSTCQAVRLNQKRLSVLCPRSAYIEDCRMLLEGLQVLNKLGIVAPGHQASKHFARC